MMCVPSTRSRRCRAVAHRGLEQAMCRSRARARDVSLGKQRPASAKPRGSTTGLWEAKWRGYEIRSMASDRVRAQGLGLRPQGESRPQVEADAWPSPEA